MPFAVTQEVMQSKAILLYVVETLSKANLYVYAGIQSGCKRF